MVDNLALQLITHPVLHGETQKHIKASDMSKKGANAISAFMKYKTFLDSVSIDCSDIISKLKKLNICEDTINEFNKFYSSAIVLPYGDPSKVFEKYFSFEPPFAESGDKKSEFPDAFVIDAFITFLEEHRDTSVLVVSDDSDWEKALSRKQNVEIIRTLDDALLMLNRHEENLWKYIDPVYSEIAEEIRNATEHIWFNIADYECQEDVEIESVELDSLDSRIVPLSITDSQMVFQIMASLKVDGTATILDYDKSIWDSEDHEYIFTAFSIMDFQEATGMVRCEITIDINESSQISLGDLKFVASHGVSIRIDEEKAVFTDINFDTDIQGEMLNTLEEYYRH